MAKLTEQQARRVCEALGVPPDAAHPVGKKAGEIVWEPAWRIAQRAAEEESR